MRWDVGRQLIIIMLAWAALAVCSPAPAQDTWEYSPYRIRVWLAVEPAAEMTTQMRHDILQTVMQQAPVYAGATWQLSAVEAPPSLAPTMVVMLDELTVEQVGAADEKSFGSDKLMLLTVRRAGAEFVVACRELDCRARVFSQVVRTPVPQLSRLPRDAAATVAEAFAALVRVEESRGKSASVRVRAGGLVIHEHCPSLVKAGDVLRPVIRRNDRNGEPKPGGIQDIEWTYLAVREQQEYLLDCEVYSAMRNPLAGRSSASVERMALKVHARGQTTDVQLLTLSEVKQPLEGYEIFTKKPLPKDSEEKNLAVRLGMTDWRGIINVPQDDLPLRILYVKNGTYLLARLPVVPGYEAEQSVELPSDDKRLEAESFVKGMESTVMDLVARREILAARIRRRIDEGKLDQARELLEEIKAFQTKDDLELLITNRQQTGLASSDERQQRRIDQLLSGTRILLNKYLDPDKLVALQRMVEDAEKSPPATATAKKPDVTAEADVEKTAAPE